jgi:hypothetical protein
LQLDIQLLTRDYSEVQKGKDICDRIGGSGKTRVRSWQAAGNDLLNAMHLKEGFEYADGIKNVKVAVAEVTPNAGIKLFYKIELYIIFTLFLFFFSSSPSPPRSCR